WEIESDGGLEFGGWNLDDVCVYGIGDSDIPGGGTDSGGDGSGNLNGDDGDEVDPWGYGCGCASTGSGRTSGGLLIGLWLAGIAMLRRRQD
ncbi:MAG: MYXO-CTERM domain-containing protein, partial [Myxococcota bacterium]